MIERRPWRQWTLDLMHAGFSYYAIAKECADFDNKKVKRWADGKAIPDGDEGRLLEAMHDANCKKKCFT